MAQRTAIEWTDLSWNPVHGCSKVSPGCAHCYAAELSLRYRHTTLPWTPANAEENVLLKPHKLREPLRTTGEWAGRGAAAAAAGKTDGKLVFVNSMSDLFHEQVPDEFIAQVFGVMESAPQHTFQVLTKRPDRMRELMNRWYLPSACSPPSNVWLGVSIENRRFVHRADLLRQTPAAVRFVSAEPLLGPLMRDGWAPELGASEPLWSDGHAGPELDLADIDWLIAGGESGSGHRPMREEWARALRDACLAQRTPFPPPAQVHAQPSLALARREGLQQLEASTAFFFKQWGGARPGGEALLDGREWHEFPSRRVAAA